MGNDIKGKVAFVTGAASKRGMGHAVAVRLAQEVADVAVFDRFAAPKSAFGGDENWGGLMDKRSSILLELVIHFRLNCKYMIQIMEDIRLWRLEVRHI